MLCQCLIQVLQDWGKLELSQYLVVTAMMINALSVSHTSPPGLGSVGVESVPRIDSDDDKCSVSVSYKTTRTEVSWS